MRIDKDNYYLDIAETILERGTCLRRNYGAVIVKNDEIVSTGYTGSPRGEANCCDIGKCKRQELNVPRGERYELCCSVHAEQNAIISASRQDMLGSTLYLVGKEVNGEYVKDTKPCDLCNRFIKNAGIEKVIVRIDKEQLLEIGNGIPTELFKFDIRKTLLDCEEKGTIDKGTLEAMDIISNKAKEKLKEINDNFKWHGYEVLKPNNKDSNENCNTGINLIKIFEDQYGPLPGSVEDKIKYIKENIIIKE